MSLFLRALLPEPDERPLRELLAFCSDRGHDLRAELGSGPAPDAVDWREAVLLAPGGDAMVELDVSVDDGAPDSLLVEELDEFRDLLEDADAPGGAVQRVSGHLDRTQAIVAVRVLASGGDEALQVARTVLDFYAGRPDVLLQVDGEGFFAGEELLVETG